MSHSCAVRVRDLVPRAVRLYGANWRPLLILAGANTLLYLPSLALSTVPPWQWLLSFAAGLPAQWTTLAMLAAAGQAPGQATMLEVLRSPRGKYWRCLAGWLVCLGIWAAPGLTALVGALVVPIGLRLGGPGGWLTAAGAMIFSLAGLLAGSVVAVWASVRLCLLGVVLVSEERTSWLPLRRSWELTRRHVWQTIGVFVLLALCWAPGIALGVAARDDWKSLRIVQWPWFWCSTVLATLTAPLFATALVALYQAMRAEEQRK